MRYRNATLVALMVLGTNASAQAAPVNDFFDRLNETLAPLGGEIEVTLPSGKIKGGVAAMTDVTLVTPGSEVVLGKTATFGTVTVLPGDLMLVDSMVLSGFDRSESGVRVAFDNLFLDNVLLPPPGTIDPMILAQSIGGLTAENVRVEADGENFAVDLVSFAIAADPEIGTTDPTAISFVLEVTGLIIGQSVMDAMPGNLPGVSDRLIGQKVDLRLPIHWDVTSGLLTMAELAVVVPDLGTYQLGVQFGGVTLPFLTELVAFGAEQAAGTSTDPAAQQAFGMKILSQLSFAAGSIQLIDDGMVGATLREASESSRQTENEVKVEAVEELARGLGDIGLSDDFIDLAGTALMGFFDQQGTLGLDAFPPTPISLIEIVALAQSPPLLIEKLTLEPIHVAP